MTKLGNSPTRREAINFLSSAASYGNLGLFVGAGLSKAVLNDVNEIALSWNDLLERTAISLGVDYSSVGKEGANYPEIASRICQKTLLPFPIALRKLKSAIAALTCWYPD